MIKVNELSKSSNLEDLIFPEIKFQHHIYNKLNVHKYSEISQFKDFICIKSERFKNDKMVEESLWIHEDSKIYLDDAINTVKELRNKKNNKKKIAQEKMLKAKEKKFNKIYDHNHELPRDLRKSAYKHFVLNERVYQKEIRIENILKYLNENDAVKSKEIIKKVRKIVKDLSFKNKDYIYSDYNLKYNKKIYIDEVNANFQRSLEILKFDEAEIKKLDGDFSEEVIQSIIDRKISTKLDKIVEKEKNIISKKINFIKDKIDVSIFDRDILLNTLGIVLKIYNNEEMYRKFIYNTFKFYCKRTKTFSEKQNEVFSIRKKFRNRITVTYDEHKFETCFYIKYSKIESHYKEFIESETKKILPQDFEKFFTQLNKEYIDKRWDLAKQSIDNFVHDKYYFLIQKNKEFKNMLIQSDFKKELIKLTIKYLKRAPENRRKEINKERLEEIFKGQYTDYLELVQREILKSKLKIDYKNLFPLARSMKRKFKFFIGKTNSGKTYKAFNELTKYNSGAYLSPLRLLALEGQEEIQKRDRKCSMLTGEEKNIIEGAEFVSSTIEMLNAKKELDCIVIDEIQMLKDVSRGWAWTQAMVGAPSENIILTGSEEVLPLVKKLIEYTGDTLEITRLKRKSPLRLNNKVTAVEHIKPSTAIVAFSRMDVLKLKLILKKRKVSIIYGNLGPDVRKEEARKFREGETEILIATDAIAMGLNLPIENVLFYKHTKNINNNTFELDEQLVHQISGRAGRYGLKNIGYVGALNNKTLRYVRQVMSQEIPTYDGKAFIKPNAEYIDKIKDILDINSFSEAIYAFDNLFMCNNNLFECAELDKIIELSKEIDELNLSTNENLVLSSAPVRENNDNSLYFFKKFAFRAIENFYLSEKEKKSMNAPEIAKFERMKKTNDSKVLKESEEIFHNIDLYSWFKNQYPETFKDKKLDHKKKVINSFILDSIEELKKL